MCTAVSPSTNNINIPSQMYFTRQLAKYTNFLSEITIDKTKIMKQKTMEILTYMICPNPEHIWKMINLMKQGNLVDCKNTCFLSCFISEMLYSSMKIYNENIKSYID
ncbi:hypothetical protein ACF0H5_008140 [Mactra antiquata]